MSHAIVLLYDLRFLLVSLFFPFKKPSKAFTLPESQVVVLGGVERLRTGEIIFAVYPDTTTLYQATVVQPPRRMQNAGTYQSFVMVHFKDDSDEHGVTLPKAVLMKHVMRPPALSTGRVQAL